MMLTIGVLSITQKIGVDEHPESAGGLRTGTKTWLLDIGVLGHTERREYATSCIILDIVDSCVRVEIYKQIEYYSMIRID